MFDGKLGDQKTDWSFAFYSFLLCAFLACFRDIEFLKNPTFWADEGTFLFTKSLKYGWKGLFVTHSGYLQFPQSLVTTIASECFSLESAPVLTSWVSVLVCLIAPGIILWGKSVFGWNSYEKLLLAVVTVVACEDGNSYTTMNYHFIFSWISVLIFFEDNTQVSRIKLFLYGLLLLLGSLSGPLPSIIGLFFLIRFWLDRKKVDFIYLSLVSIGLAVSVYFFLVQYFSNDPSIHKNRFVNIEPAYSLVRFFLMSLTGNSIGYFEELSRVGAFLSFGLFIYVIVKFYKGNLPYANLIWATILFAVIPFLLSGSMAGGTRYIYCSNMLFFMLLLFHVKNMGRYGFAFVLAAFMVLSALIGYSPKHSNMVRLKRIDWKNEVKQWRMNPEYVIKIYPYDGWDTEKPWTIHLKDLKNEVKGE